MRRRSLVLALLVAAAVQLSSCSTLKCTFSGHSTHHERNTVDAASAGWEKDDPVDGMQVFVKGDLSDPPVLLLHELPGLMPETVRFANELVGRGYRVYMPLFFDKFGGRPGLARQLAVCAGPNFNCLSTRESRVTGKLRILRDRIAARHDGRKLGIIGMCLTGGLPLALADDRVAAVVLSQPALPFGLTASLRRSLGVSAKSLKTARDAGVYVLRNRFEQDCLVPPERFDAIAAAIPVGHLETELVPSTDPRQHSVLTVESDNPGAKKVIQHVFCFFDRYVGKVQAADCGGPGASDQLD